MCWNDLNCIKISMNRYSDFKILTEYRFTHTRLAHTHAKRLENYYDKKIIINRQSGMPRRYKRTQTHIKIENSVVNLTETHKNRKFS